MKKISIFLMSIAMLAFASCSSMQQAASSNTGAAATGQQAAIATNALYKNYNASGKKLDLTNPTNIANILTVVTAYKQLKANKGNANYSKSFTSGAVAAGTGLITTANATNYTNALLNSAGLDGVTASNIQNKVQTASTIISLFNALK